MRHLMYLLLGLAWFCPPAVAQVESSNPARGRSPRGGFQLPATGSALPDITIYDEQGEAFPLARLRGQYSVLVFGCLT